MNNEKLINLIVISTTIALILLGIGSAYILIKYFIE